MNVRQYLALLALPLDGMGAHAVKGEHGVPFFLRRPVGILLQENPTVIAVPFGPNLHTLCVLTATITTVA